MNPTHRKLKIFYIGIILGIVLFSSIVLIDSNKEDEEELTLLNPKDFEEEDVITILDPKLLEAIAPYIENYENPTFEELQDVKTIVCSGRTPEIKTLKGVELMSNIEIIDISGNQKINSIHEIKNLKNLKVINVSNTRINSLEGVFPNLKELNISRSNISIDGGRINAQTLKSKFPSIEKANIKNTPNFYFGGEDNIFPLHNIELSIDYKQIEWFTTEKAHIWDFDDERPLSFLNIERGHEPELGVAPSITNTTIPFGEYDFSFELRNKLYGASTFEWKEEGEIEEIFEYLQSLTKLYDLGEYSDSVSLFHAFERKPTTFETQAELLSLIINQRSNLFSFTNKTEETTNINIFTENDIITVDIQDLIN